MADDREYDLIVIGAGPGGYVAAVRAAQLGMKVACVEKEPDLGGVCLNTGCIPSKALLDSSENYHLLKERFREHGIIASDVKLDLSSLMARKGRVVKELTDNVRKLLEANNIRIIRGTARLKGEKEVEIRGDSEAGEGNQSGAIRAGAILLATGSETTRLPNMPLDGRLIVSSTEALSFDSVPDHLGIVGGGYIGLELGSVWRRLGSRVTIIEMLPEIAGTLDGQLSRALRRALTKQGLTFRLKTRVIKAEPLDKEVRVLLEGEGGEEEMRCDRLLVAVGRRPLTTGLGLEEAGVKLDPRSGQVVVDSRYRTSIPSVYAIGDLISGPMLAHKASAEGIAAVECIAGKAGEVNYDAIPSAVYTSPEVAGVGMTEETAKERGIEYCVGTYPYTGLGRARCLGETEGFAKIIAHAKTDRVLGAHIIGSRASDLIAECVLAMEFGASSEDIARTVHGHPTFTEGVHEAAMAVRKCSIHAS
jgi:dihydrolipoamide dehydrogenase